MTTPDPNRPQPVVSASKQVGLLVGAAFVAVGLAWFAITAGISKDSLPSTAVAVGEAVTAVLALASYLLALWHGRHAAQQVTPVSSPLSAEGRPLMTADQYAAMKAEEPATVALPAAGAQHAQAGDSWGHPVLKLGKRRTDPTRPVLAMAAHFTAKAFQAPAEIDYASHVAKWLLGRNTEFGTCVTPDTRVLTADLRWIRAGDILVGDKLLGFDEESRNPGRHYRSGVVEHAEIVKKPCYDLVFDDGTTVRCSSDHRWLTSRGSSGSGVVQRWLRTEDLKCGPTHQSAVVKPLDVWEEDESREAGYLAAAFDGEGSLEQTRHGVYANRVNFVQAENPMLAEVERCLKELGYRYNHTVTSSGTRLRVDGTPRYDKHRIEVSPRSEYIRFMGSIRPERLLPKLDVNRLGRINGRSVRLVSKTYAGEHDVVLLETTARTYFAEGLASHNCGPTSVANLALLVSTMLADAPVAFTDDEIIDLYRRSGNPNFDGKTRNPDGTYVDDNGVDMTVMLSELVKNGIGAGDRNVKALAFGKINPHDTAELWAAACLFGGVLWGSDLDVAQQSQFDAGLWDYAPRSAQWGGHATLSAPAYSDKPGTVADRTKLITWATPIDATDGFITHQVTECYVVIFPWHVGDKLFCQALDLAGVAKEYEALTGRPFPAVQPDPDPGPAPAPVPPPAPGPAPGPGPAPAPVPEDVIAWAKRTLVHKSPSHADKHAAQDLLDWAAGR